MPDSQFLTKKKYAVVTFVEEDSVEVIPSIWLVSKTETKWPSPSSSVIPKLIKDCIPPASNWILQKIKINSFSDSFSNAKRKAAVALETSHLSSDSSEADISNKRKRKRPARYETSDSSAGSESESIITTSKRFKVPSLPKSNELGGSTSNLISNSRSVLKEQNVLQQDSTPTAIYDRLFRYLEKINAKLNQLNSKVDDLSLKIDKVKNSPSVPILDYLPDDMKLPVTSIEELEVLNEKLKSDKELSAILVRILYNAGCGKSQRSFVLSLTRKVLAQEVAVQFSRYGRKGKRSFLKYNDLLNVILAAASLKYKDADREVLGDMFGKSLAGASDWNQRRVRLSNLIESSFTLSTEAV